MSCAARAISAVLVLSLLSVPTAVFAQDPPAPPAPPPAAILKEAFKDFGALASRRAATILGVGGAAALAVHPADRNINRQVRGSDYRFLGPGRLVGSAAVQLGAASGIYLLGYRVERDSAAARVGAELVRAQLVTQALKPSASRQASVESVRTAKAVSRFRLDMRRRRSRRRRCWQVISVGESRRPAIWLRRTSHRPVYTRTAIARVT